MVKRRAALDLKPPRDRPPSSAEDRTPAGDGPMTP